MAVEAVLVRLLGPVRIESPTGVVDGAGLGGRRGVALWARLVLAPNRSVSAGALGDAIWGSQPPVEWRSAMRNVLSELRTGLHRALPESPAAIVARDGGYALELPAHVRIDVELVLRAAAQAPLRLEAGQFDECRGIVGEVADWLAAELLPELDRAWLTEHRVRLHGAQWSVLIAGAQAALEMGDPARAERLAQQATELDPLREEGYRLVMRSLVAAGDRAAALREFERCRGHLHSDLNVLPAPETVALYEEIKSGTTAPAGRTSGSLRLAQVGGPFVGRTVQLDDLSAHWRSALMNGPGHVRIEGEPGIGKTRLAAEFAERVSSGGATTLYGRADDQIGVAYRPFLEAVEGYLSRLVAGERRSAMGRHAGVLARYLPSARMAVPGTASGEAFSGIPEIDQLRLFQAVADVLRAAAGRDGALLVLDDMQWGGTAGENLLEHVLADARPYPLLVVSLHRAASGADSAGPVLHLPFFDAGAVIELARHHVGDARTATRLGEQVWSASGGNPLFAVEILRTLIADGADESGSNALASARLARIVRRRMASLPRRTRRLLELASLAGLEFDPQLVAAAANGSPPAQRSSADDVAVGSDLDDFAPAQQEGLLVAAAGQDSGLAFRHALVRAVLLDDLADDDGLRQQLHRQLANALERTNGDGSGLAHLAFHAGQAAPLGDWQRALKYGLQAARLAAEASVDDDVITMTTRTLAVLDEVGAVETASRAELMTLLGSAQRTGDETAAFATLTSAFELAVAAELPRLAAAAALAFSQDGAAGGEAYIDTLRVEMYEAALAGLDQSDDILRARLLGRLATAHGWLKDIERAESFAQAALGMARRLGDRATLSTVLTSYRRLLSSGTRPAVAAALELELLDLSQALDDPAGRTRASLWRFESSVELGHGVHLEEIMSETKSAAENLRLGAYRYTWAYTDCARLLLRGDLEAADAAAVGVRASFRDWGVDPFVAEAIGYMQLMGIRHEQGRLAEIRDELAAHFKAAGVPEWEGASAFVDGELGHLDTVPGYLDRVFAGYAGAGIRSGAPLGFVAHLASPIARIHDRERAEQAFGLLIPYSGLGAYFGYFGGPIDYGLGLLAAVLGRNDDAVNHLGAAEQFSIRLGAPRWAARCAEVRRNGGRLSP